METLSVGHAGGCNLAFLGTDWTADARVRHQGLVFGTPLTMLVEQAMTLILDPGPGCSFKVVGVPSTAASDKEGAATELDVGGQPGKLVIHVPERLLPDLGDGEGILLLAVHLVALLVARTAPLRTRDTLWLATCVMALAMLDRTMHQDRRPVAEGFLRVWTRAKLGMTGDPPAWDDIHAALVLAKDPWAGAFMNGFHGAVGDMELPPAPVSLVGLTQAATRLAADAMLRSAVPLGRA